MDDGLHDEDIVGFRGLDGRIRAESEGGGVIIEMYG